MPGNDSVSFGSGGVVSVDGTETVDKEFQASADLTIQPVKASTIVYGPGADKFLKTDSDTVVAANALLSDYEIVSTPFDKTTYTGLQLPGTGRPFAVSRTANTMTAWMEVYDAPNVKGVKIQLSQSGANIVGRVLEAKYIEGSVYYGQVDFDTQGNQWNICTGGSTKGYGINHIILKRITTDTLTLSNAVTVGTTLSVNDGVRVVAVGDEALTSADTYAASLAIGGELALRGRHGLTLTGALSGTGGTLAVESNPVASIENVTVNGGVVTTAWQTLAENCQLSDLTSITAVLGGGWMGGKKNANTFFFANDGQSGSCQFQYIDKQATTKCVTCELRQNGKNVEISSAYMFYKDYVSGDENGYYFAGSGNHRSASGNYRIESFAASFAKGKYGLVRMAPSANSMSGGTLRIGGEGDVVALLNVESATAVPSAGEIIVMSNGEYRLNVDGAGYGKGVGDGTSPIVVENGGVVRVGKLHPFVPAKQKIALDGGMLDTGWNKFETADRDVFLNNLTLSNGARVFGSGNVRVGFYTNAIWQVQGNAPSSFDAGILVAADLPPGAASPWDVWTIDVADVTQSEAVDFTVSGFMSLLSESYIEPTVLKTGSGTMLLTGKCKSQSAGKYLPFTIREGVLKLGVADAMCASQNIELNGGTLELLEGTSDIVGTLAVSASSSLVVPSGASIAFADSSSVPWSASVQLNVITEDNSSSVRFGTDSQGLSAEQLSNVRCNGRKCTLDNNGYLKVGGFFVIIR